MDINNNQQINMFLKGMNTDISDTLLDPQQYRDAENLRIVTDGDSNSGELRLIEGTKLIKNFGTSCDIVYINSIRNYVVVITKHKTDGTWSIYRSNDYGVNWDIIFGPCSSEIWKEGEDPHISGVLNWESDENVKFYFVDDVNKHGIMSIDITEQTNSTDIYSLMPFVKNGLKSPVASLSNKNGSLYSSKVQYAYRIYKINGNASMTSPYSNVLSLYKNATEGGASNEQTSKAVDITIENINSSNRYNYIQIYRIQYQQVGQMPSVYLVCDSKFNGTSFVFTDTGEYREQLSAEEFLALDGISINPKLVTSKNNYLFAGNVSYTQDDVDKLFKDFDAVSTSTGNYKNDDGELKHHQFDVGNEAYNEEYWHKSENDNTIGGTGNISWNFVRRNITLSIEGESSDYKNIYKNDETYRFGIILYDSNGHASSVKWIADIRIPPFNYNTDIKFVDKNGVEIPTTDYTKDKVYAKSFKYLSYDIQFTVNNLPSECSGYEIVRCVRQIKDKRVLTQGLLGYALHSYYKYNDDSNIDIDTYKCFPSGLLTQQYIKATAGINDRVYSKSDSSVIQFASPEYCYGGDSFKDILNIYKDKLQIESVVKYTVGQDSHTHQPFQSYGGRYMYSEQPDPNIDGYGFKADVNNMKIGLKVDMSTISYNTIDYIDGHGGIGVVHNIYAENRRRQDDFESSAWHFAHFNYMVPRGLDLTAEGTVQLDTFANITNTAYVESPAWNTFSNDDDFRFQDDVTAITNGLEFINWSAPLIVDNRLLTNERKALREDVEVQIEDIEETEFQCAYFPIGTGGKQIVFTSGDNTAEYRTKDYTLAPITVANVIKQCYPYGGYTSSAINNSQYYSFGDYVRNTGADSSITVRSGDGYVGLFRYNAAHVWNTAQEQYAVKMSTVYIVPIQSDVDLNAQHGEYYRSSLTNGFAIQDKTAAIAEYNYIQEKDCYMYNSAYNQEPTIKPHSTQQYTDADTNNYDVRIHNSRVKSINEHIDNWLYFGPIDYIEADSKYGQLTQLDVFKDVFLFWQEEATGVVSSNERNIVQDTNNIDLILGTGDVLQRIDYLSTQYGMKYGQFCNAKSDDSIYWWDGNQKDLLQFYNRTIVPISITKQVKQYVQNGTENSKPCTSYDDRYKEIIFSAINNESIAYSEQFQSFISRYKFEPKYSISNKKGLLLVGDNKLYKFDEQEHSGSSELFETSIYPYLKFVVNKESTFVKTFDIQIIGGRLYGGEDLSAITMDYSTPLKQQSSINLTSNNVTNREYDFRLTIPRNGNNTSWGDRMRGKTMQCQLSSTSNSTDFSLQYITTKYRMSWS